MLVDIRKADEYTFWHESNVEYVVQNWRALGCFRRKIFYWKNQSVGNDLHVT